MEGTLKRVKIYSYTIKRSKFISLHQTYLLSMRAGAICLLKGKTKITKNVLVPQNTVSGCVELLQFKSFFQIY